MKRIYLLFLISLFVQTGFTQSRIQIAKPGSADSSFDFSGFSADSGAGSRFFSGMRKNLTLPSQFKEAPPSSADFRVLGSARTSGGQVEVTVQVVDRGQDQRRFGKRYAVADDQVEGLARLISDEITEALTERPGFASKRILFVGQRAGSRGKDVYAMFPDGGGMVQLTRDDSVVLAPKWAPDGNSFVYTSFHRGFPDVYQQTLQPAGRRVVSSSSGMNSGGAVSPDGSKIALILSREGRPELYVKDLASGRTTRLTRTASSAKSSPSWSPDGKQLVFVSGHQGIPNLYVIGVNGGEPRRITRGGGENLSPHWGPNGLIAFTRRREGRYAIAILNPNNGDTRFVSPGDADYEDPSWAADGFHLVASRTIRGQSALYLLDMEGKAAKSLLQGQGNWYMPSFRP
ncbi:MAG: DPP IV N-terminal domain-containing protein [Kiritimatiellia bacterium]